MNTYQLRMPKRRKHMSATVFGTAAIALAIGGLAQPGISHAAWDIEVYDRCLQRNSELLCCLESGGDWDDRANKCVAPLTAQTPPQNRWEVGRAPGGVLTQAPSAPATSAPQTSEAPPPQAPRLPWFS